jgi:hypothetical protein
VGLLQMLAAVTAVTAVLLPLQVLLAACLNASVMLFALVLLLLLLLAVVWVQLLFQVLQALVMICCLSPFASCPSGWLRLQAPAQAVDHLLHVVCGQAPKELEEHL